MEETKYTLVHKRSSQTEEVTNTITGDGFTTVYTPTISVRFEHVDGALVNDDYSLTTGGEVVAPEVTAEAEATEIAEVAEVAEVAPEELAPETTDEVVADETAQEAEVTATDSDVAPEVTA